MTTRDGKTQGLTNVDFTKPLIHGPVQFGFDDSFILPGSLDMYPYAFARNNIWQGKGKLGVYGDFVMEVDQLCQATARSPGGGNPE